MALPKEVFKQKMIEGRQRAKELRDRTLEQRKIEAMERAVANRMAQIKQQEEDYGGYSEVSEPSMPPFPDDARGTDQQTHNHRLPDLPRDSSPAHNPVPSRSLASHTAGPAGECQLCKGFPWSNVPINVARDRFRWLTLEFQRVGRIMTDRESQFTRSRGCSVCGGHPSMPDHWYHVKNTVDKATGVEYTVYACSQPCYVDLPRKYPRMFGLNPANPTP